MNRKYSLDIDDQRICIWCDNRQIVSIYKDILDSKIDYHEVIKILSAVYQLMNSFEEKKHDS